MDRAISSRYSRKGAEMDSIEKAIIKLGNCAKPILFETELEETPYTGAGTCFLVGNAGQACINAIPVC